MSQLYFRRDMSHNPMKIESDIEKKTSPTAFT